MVHPVDGAIERLMSGLRSSSLTEVIPFEADAYIVELDVKAEAGGVVHRTLRESGAKVEGGMGRATALLRTIGDRASDVEVLQRNGLPVDDSTTGGHADS